LGSRGDGGRQAGEPADRDKFRSPSTASRSQSAAHAIRLDEAKCRARCKQPKIQIKVSLGLGKGRDPRADLRSHQGICRDQRRLPVVTAKPAPMPIQAHSVRRLRADRCRQAHPDRAAAAGQGARGLWDFPAARSSPASGPEATLIRELAEEIGIT